MRDYKRYMRKFIITCCLLAAILVVALVEYYCIDWQKSYLLMSFTAVFFLYWAIEFVLDYVAAKKDYEERFKYYAAELVNKNNLTMEDIEKNRKKYFAKFKRSIANERWWQIGKICLCFGIAIAIIVAIFV